MWKRDEGKAREEGYAGRTSVCWVARKVRDLGRDEVASTQYVRFPPFLFSFLFLFQVLNIQIQFQITFNYEFGVSNYN